MAASRTILRAGSDATGGRPPSGDGFTLIEVTVSLFLLGLIAVGALQALNAANRVATGARAEAAALALAQSRMSDIAAVSGGAVTNSSLLAVGTNTETNVPMVIDASSGSTNLLANLTRVVTDASRSVTNTNGLVRTLTLRRVEVTASYRISARRTTNTSVVTLTTLRSAQ